MIEQKAHTLLESKKMSRTPFRVEVLKALLEADSALSEAEIREKVSVSFDRTTLYRTLKIFLDQDVIHSITLEGGELRYALTQHREQSNSPYHTHFYCDICNGVYCLSRCEFTPPELPPGFRAKGFDLLVNGVCSKCSEIKPL